MKILISGATGFVGTNLIDAFQEKFTIKTLGLPHEQTDYSWDKLEGLLGEDIDAYIHLAGKAHDTSNTSDPESYFTINTGLTQKLYGVFTESNARLFIAFSSVKAIADTVEGVLTEDYQPSPKTPYGQSKLKAEEFLFSQPQKEGKRFVILRPCMIHGPGNKGNLNLLYKFVAAGIPYPFAAFENHRSFLSIDNLVFIIEKVLLSEMILSGAYQVSDDESLSTNELVKVIGQAKGKPARLWKLPISTMKLLAQIGDVLRLPINSERLKKLTENYIVSNQKIKKALDIQQMPTSATEGLYKTIKSFE